MGFILLFALALFFIQTTGDRNPFPEERRHLLIYPLLILVFAGVSELLLRFYIQGLIRKRGRLHPIIQYANLLMEISVPTGVIFWFMNVGNYFLALSSPGSYTYYVFIVLCVLRLDWRICVVAGFLGAAQYGGLVYFALSERPELFPPQVLDHPFYFYGRCTIMAVTGVVVGVVSSQLRKRAEDAVEIVEERNRILDTFGKHVSPEVVNQLMNQEHEIESREVAVLFLDIRDFTSYSERRSPVEVIGRLNEAFAFMIDIINDHHGIINKFLGDGFMAVFGAPVSVGNNAAGAIQAAREILEELDRRNARFPDDAIQVGIGIHFGEAVTGSVGSPRRKEYTIIGDVVNLASRMQGLNKHFNSSVLISDAAVEAAGLDTEELTRLPRVRVKGRQEAIQPYTL